MNARRGYLVGHVKLRGKTLNATNVDMMNIEPPTLEQADAILAKAGFEVKQADAICA